MSTRACFLASAGWSAPAAQDVGPSPQQAVRVGYRRPGRRAVGSPQGTSACRGSRRMATFLKRGLLLFWAAWLTVVFTTNLLDAAKAAGLLSDSWAFASGNHRLLVETTARYGTPGWLNGLLFLGVICWE